MNTPPNVPGGSYQPPNNPGGGYQPPNVPGRGGPQGIPPGGYQGGSEGVPPSAPPPKRAGIFTPRNIIIAVIVLLFLCCCCAAVGAFAYRQLVSQASSAFNNLGTLVPEQAQAAVVGSAFMTDLQAGNWKDAYALCSPTLQNELGSAAGLGTRITNNKVQPVTWALTDFNDGSPIKIDGTTTFSGNRQGTLHLEIQRAGANYLINGFLLQ